MIQIEKYLNTTRVCPHYANCAKSMALLKKLVTMQTWYILHILKSVFNI